MTNQPTLDERAIFAIERPSPKLLTYYALSSLVAGPFFLIPLIPLYFRYHTLRYRFDAQGLSMRWGILFRREVNLTYARIQDIHLRSNVVERWLNLARVEVQTASGSATAEMTLEGLLEFEAIRDYLYTRMRGARDHAPGVPAVPGAPGPAASPDDLAAVLREVAAELRALRCALPAGRRSGDDA